MLSLRVGYYTMIGRNYIYLLGEKLELHRDFDEAVKKILIAKI